MKTAIKEVYVVSGSNWIQKIVLDSSVFSGSTSFVEAATQAVEKSVKFGGKNIGALIEVYNEKDEKDLQKHIWISSYVILNNAAMYDEAEQVRQTLLKATGIDMKNCDKPDQDK